MRWTRTVAAFRLAAMTNETWHWQAIDPARNIARNYILHTSTDLFGWTVIEQRWGRIGTRGQSKRTAFRDPFFAAQRIREIQSRRANSKARIGMSYRLV